jgi:hypothetical protein
MMVFGNLDLVSPFRMICIISFAGIEVGIAGINIPSRSYAPKGVTPSYSAKNTHMREASN